MSNPATRIYHNPRCSKSREALALLRARGVDPEVVLYLEAGLDVAEITGLVQKLGIAAHDLVRTKEEAYADAKLSAASSLEDVARAIVAAPILLERPLVVRGARAVIARPPERLLELLSAAPGQ
jgi:arsenate reductase (glutaredoxin)